MKEPLEPLSATQKEVLERGRFEPPAGLEDRLFARLQGSIAANPLPAPPPPARVMGQTARLMIGGSILTATLAAGVLLGRTVLAPEPLPPKVIERVVRVEVPIPAAPSAALPPAAEPPLRKPLAAGPSRSGPALADTLLAQERELIDTGRSALLHRDPTAALAALEAHRTKFPTARLDEERESLWVQALVMSGSLDAAKARAKRFHQQYPNSLLGPTVDAALEQP